MRTRKLHIARHRNDEGSTPGIPEMEQLNAPASLDSWLDLLVKLLRLPSDSRQSIRDELEAHLRERVRDLMIGGAAETDALATAIGELGEAAELARRFEHAHTQTRRRLIMHGSLIGLGLGVVVAGAVTVTSMQTGNAGEFPSSVFQETHQQQQQEPPGWLEESTVTLEPGQTLDEFIRMVESASDNVAVLVRRSDLDSVGIDRTAEINLEISREIPLRRALDLVLTEVSDGQLTWRYADGVIELGSRERLERESRQLVSYDVSDILWNLNQQYERPYDEAVEDVTGLIGSLVEPESWETNGGMIAQMHVVGGTMFINAPPRMHERVRWVLAQLSEGEDAASAASSGDEISVENLSVFARQKQLESLAGQLIEARSSLSQCRAQHDDLAARVEKEDGMSAEDLRVSEADPTLRSLQQNLAHLRVQHRRMVDEFGAKHRTVFDLERQLAAASDVYEQELRKITRRNMEARCAALKDDIEHYDRLVTDLEQQLHSVAVPDAAR